MLIVGILDQRCLFDGCASAAAICVERPRPLPDPPPTGSAATLFKRNKFMSATAGTSQSASSICARGEPARFSTCISGGSASMLCANASIKNCASVVDKIPSEAAFYRQASEKKVAEISRLPSLAAPSDPARALSGTPGAGATASTRPVCCLMRCWRHSANSSRRCRTPAWSRPRCRRIAGRDISPPARASGSD